MFDMNKLTNAIPEDMKDKLKDSAMEKLGWSNSEGVKSSEVEAAPNGETVDQDPAETNASDATPDATSPDATSEYAQVDDSAQPESTDEDKEKAA